MKKTSLFSFFFLILFLAPACKDDPVPEARLRISTDAGAFMVLAGPEFDLTVTVESVMPSQGVRVSFTLKDELSGNTFLQGSLATSDKQTKFKISSIPRQVVCVCTVTVISNSDKANEAKADFRLAYK